MVPTRPATAASLEVIEAEEAKLDLSLVEAAVARRNVLDLHKVDVERLGFPDLEIERIPETATVIDLRSEGEYRSWHWPGALRLDFSKALNAYPSFDKTVTYVVYCEIGLKSAHLAEFMQKADFKAFHVRGGLRTLRKMSAR
jgi:rhodanese-related sulfurtransferase